MVTWHIAELHSPLEFKACGKCDLCEEEGVEKETILMGKQAKFCLNSEITSEWDAEAAEADLWDHSDTNKEEKLGWFRARYTEDKESKWYEENYPAEEDPEYPDFPEVRRLLAAVEYETFFDASYLRSVEKDAGEDDSVFFRLSMSIHEDDYHISEVRIEGVLTALQYKAFDFLVRGSQGGIDMMHERRILPEDFDCLLGSPMYQRLSEMVVERNFGFNDGVFVSNTDEDFTKRLARRMRCLTSEMEEA